MLESCAKSKIFKPPNPWLVALLSLLLEIFDLPTLKLNLRFEIEVLFNNLSVKMKGARARLCGHIDCVAEGCCETDVKPTNLLKDRSAFLATQRAVNSQCLSSITIDLSNHKSLPVHTGLLPCDSSGPRGRRPHHALDNQRRAGAAHELAAAAAHDHTRRQQQVSRREVGAWWRCASGE